jgi:hypothetical protein
LRVRRLSSIVALSLGLVGLPSGVRAQPQPQPPAPPAPLPLPPSAPAPAPIPELQSQLSQARTDYENGLYPQAEATFLKYLSVPIQATAPDADQRRAIYRESRPYYAATLLALGKSPEAEAVIREQLLDETTGCYYELPRGLFPAQVSTAFGQVEQKYASEIQKCRERFEAAQVAIAKEKARYAAEQKDYLEKLEIAAADEVVVTERSRWPAVVPFGVGQFYNGNVGLGVFFAVSETLAIATTIAGWGVAEDAANTECPANDPETGAAIDCDALASRFTAAQVVNWVGFGSTGALVIAGIIEAQVSFVDEHVEHRKRPLPKKPLPPQITPQVGGGPDGFYLGVRGSF